MWSRSEPLPLERNPPNLQESIQSYLLIYMAPICCIFDILSVYAMPSQVVLFVCSSSGRATMFAIIVTSMPSSLYYKVITTDNCHCRFLFISLNANWDTMAVKWIHWTEFRGWVDWIHIWSYGWLGWARAWIQHKSCSKFGPQKIYAPVL